MSLYYSNLFINPDAAFVAMFLMLFLVIIVVLSRFKMFPKGIRILIAFLISLSGMYYMFVKSANFESADGTLIFLVISSILILLALFTLLNKMGMPKPAAFFASLALSGIATYIISQQDLLFTWFETLQYAYVLVVGVMCVGIAWLLFRRSI